MEENRLKLVEDAIATELQSLVDNGLAIENRPMPQGPMPRARAIVFFSGESSNPPGGVARPMQQTSTLEFTINVELVDQRSQQLAYPFVEGIKALLVGFRPTVEGISAVYHQSTRYEAMQVGDGIRWRYAMQFTCNALYRGMR